MATIYRITDLSNKHVVSMLERELSKLSGDQKLLENYHPDFRSHPANLFYILEQGRFSQGGFFLAYDDDNLFLACSGWHPYNDTTALVAARAYVAPRAQHRYPIANYITPLAIRESWQYPEQWICFNDHNYTFYKGIARGKWKEHPVYKYLEPVGKRTINYTEQWVVRVKKPEFELGGLLDPNWSVPIG